MTFFDDTELAPPDAILGLTTAFRADPREGKVNLGVGAYSTDDLEPLVLAAVAQAERDLVESGENYEYQSISGHDEFLDRSRELVFGPELEGVAERLRSVQSLGGTGALRIAGEFLRQEVTAKVAVSNPTWANHSHVFSRVGLGLESFPWIDEQTHALAFPELVAALNELEKGSAVLFQPCCHNPTGIDPTHEQWAELCELTRERELLPVFDFAYQGFGTGVEEDAHPVRLFAASGQALLVAQSYSKNLGLYGERVGALHVLTSEQAFSERTLSQIKRIIRALWSNPPCHGVRVAARVLGGAELRRSWIEELGTMRDRIADMRKLLSNGLEEAGVPGDFAFLQRQRGMFSYSGLSESQVDRLREEFGIYMPASGRINVAGLSTKNLPTVVAAIASVTKA